MVDFISLIISKEEVLAGDTSEALAVLLPLLESRQTAKQFKESVDISFHGYNDVRWELFEIEEVRKFVFELDDKFPYWLYFLTKFGTGLQALYLCMMPPFLTEEAKAEIFPQRLASLLENRWLPAMSAISEIAGESEYEMMELADRAVSYFLDGPFRTTRDK